MYTNYYYNPYVNNRIGIKKLFNFKNLDFNKILSGTSKTLNVINQAIPIYYQIKPIIANAKTLFKVANIIKAEPEVETIKNVETAVSNNPTFFL